MNPDRIAMSQRDRDTLTVLKPVLDGLRSQAEAAGSDNQSYGLICDDLMENHAAPNDPNAGCVPWP
ncbi:hypothetical protein [Tautonia marina]|uniref:hypothetical protein n=1 Tax=Tautonia marina TaxID=2653855 RepID=UPI0012613709|nr:hypothetical protein [Tautonia marina]